MVKRWLAEKGIESLLSKIDVRMKPEEEEIKRFKPNSSRRYMNVGILTYNFYQTIAERLKDDLLKDQANIIKQAVYEKDGLKFDTAVNLFKLRLNEMGAWKSVQGLSHWEKMQILSKFKRKGKVG